MSSHILDRCVAIGPDGRMYSLSLALRDLGVRNDLLQQAANKTGTPLRNVFKIGGGLPVHMLASGDPVYAVRLPFLRLNTSWGMDENSAEPVLVPKFVPGPGTVEHQFDWVPMPGCAAYFVTRLGTDPYLSFISPGGPGREGNFFSYRLPLSNLFDDGRICMGDGWSSSDCLIEYEAGRISAEQYLEQALAHFSGARWNSHLTDGRRTEAARMVRFTPDGKQLPPSAADWRPLCKQIAGSGYNWVVELAHNLGDVP
jgi:hypothetical protein